MKLRYKIVTGVLAVLAITIAASAWYISHDEDCSTAPLPAVQGDSMTAVRRSCFGGPEVLELVPVEKPVPGADEILVRVQSAAVNPLDWHYMRGEPYLMRPAGAGIGTPSNPGLGVDFAGTVEAAGANVTRFKPGDRVFGGRFGAFAEYVSASESRAMAHIPESVDFGEAAGVPIAGVTALQALRDIGNLQPGQKVLVNGASGGVGTFAVQIARAMGAEVHGVCSTRNVEMVRSLGADKVWDYTKENYTEGNEQYDLIIDNVGNHSLLANRQVMKQDARLIIIGGSAGKWFGFLLGPLAAAVLDPFVDQHFGMFIAELKSDDLATLANMMAEGKLKTVIDRHFPLAEVPDAIRYSESGRARGKIIIDVY